MNKPKKLFYIFSMPIFDNACVMQILCLSGVTGSAPKTPNAFALFVKENYKHHKKEGVTHKNVMEVLSLEFKKFKLNK